MLPLRTNSPHYAAARLMLILSIALLLAACGSKDKDKIPVAKVGDRTISLGYFERKMNSMKPQDLPQNIDSLEGKKKLLNTMIDKEVMVAKAKEFGYSSDKEIDKAAEKLAVLKAVQLMKDDAMKDLSFISDEEAQAYYQSLHRVLDISFMLFDHEEEATEARKLVMGGEKWAAVAAKFNAGDPGPTGNWTMQLHYGTIVDDVEKKIFSLQVGEVSQPIESIYGYFLIRLDGETKDRGVPPFDQLKDKIVTSIHRRDMTLKTVERINAVLEKYHFHIDEDVLQIVYDALPPDGELVPVPPKEEWGHLDIKPADMDKELMSWDDEQWSLRRFYDYYEATPWVGRPRRERRLGGLRRFVKEIAIRDLMPKEARALGYMERPEVQDELRERREQAMISKLHQKYISANVQVTKQDIDKYWEKNKDRYAEPMTREGVILVSSDSLSVQHAYEQAKQGKSWDSLLEKFGDEKLMPKGERGLFGPVGKSNNMVFTPLLWTQAEEGEICKPLRLANGTWGIGRLDTIHPEKHPKVIEVAEKVRGDLKAQLAEKLFRQKMEEWSKEISVQSYPKNLKRAVYQPKRAPMPPVAAGAKS